MRTSLLAGNWKMNKLNADLEAFFASFAKECGDLASLKDKVDLLFAVPYTLLDRATRLAAPHGIRIAAQNVHFEASGAFTGEVSLAMLKEIGVTATLVGHSERRQYFGETDATVAKKVKAALAQGFLTVACVGETLDERQSEQTDAVVTRQVNAVLAAADAPTNLVIAYEPVWAIGTGLSATSAQAQQVHKLIRTLVGHKFGPDAANGMRILYGGSANPSNIGELMDQADIDGGLVGGASLKPADFAAMVKACR